MMKRNYLSAWYVAMYFNYEITKSTFSKNGLKAFEKGYIKHVNQLVNLSSTWVSLILSNQGFQKLENSEIFISKSSHSIADKNRNNYKYADFEELLQPKQQQTISC